jgi:putative flippase GtrA
MNEHGSPVGGKFTRFAGVGLLGTLVDAAVFSATLLGLGLHHGICRALASWAAMTATWLLNRRFVFDNSGRSLTGEYLSYVASSIAGALVNLAVYLMVYAEFPQYGHLPPYIIGAGAGLFVNFLLYDRVTFRGKADRKP